jgi:hypothetical protein
MASGKVNVEGTNIKGSREEAQPLSSVQLTSPHLIHPASSIPFIVTITY